MFVCVRALYMRIISVCEAMSVRLYECEYVCVRATPVNKGISGVTISRAVLGRVQSQLTGAFFLPFR